jgi:hypothetical protein
MFAGTEIEVLPIGVTTLLKVGIILFKTNIAKSKYLHSPKMVVARGDSRD